MAIRSNEVHPSARSERPRTSSRRTALVACLLAVVAALTVGTGTAAAAPAPAPVPEQAASPDVTLAANPSRYIVVLGARMEPLGNPPQILKQRMNRAAGLARSHPLSRVIASGGNTWWLPVSEASFMQAGLLQRGVPAWQILGEHASTSTVDNARNVVAMLKSLRASGAVIVTNGFHMKRAMANFRDAAKTQHVDLKLTPAYA